ncbi:MAG TPA: YciI family protein [Acetobacteraceae bacterium]|nr:YciI family protein [Acetobacteraceae bacterium]
MRCMVLVKASADSENGVMPTAELLSAMGKYNEELIQAGIMQGGGGLKPTSQGVRVLFSGAERSRIDGPFGPTEQQVAGYWIWQVKSMDEAIDWLRRCPNPMLTDSEVEIRPEYEAADFAR